MLTNLLLEQFTAADREREQRILTARKRYEGEYNNPLKSTASDKTGADNTKINYARLIVNKGVSTLFGFDLKFEVGGKKESAEEKWLMQCLNKNRRMSLFHKLGINGGIGGDAFLKLLPADPARYGHKFPRIVLWAPENVKVRWSPEDCDEILSYTYSWHGVDPQTARPVAYRQVIERDGGQWLIRDQESPGMSTQWRDRSEAAVWPWAWAPVLSCQNLPVPNCFWGAADLEADILHLIDALNFVLSNTRRIYRVDGHPQRWARGLKASEFKGGIDDVILLESEKGELKYLEMQGDLTRGLSLADALKELLHELSRIPEVATGKVEDLGQLSGLALKILYGPIAELTLTKRLGYGELLSELGSRLLEMGGHAAELEVAPQWPEVIPGDPKGNREVAIMDSTLGVSSDTLLTQLGYDPAAEAAQKAKEQKAKAALGGTLLDDFERGGRSGEDEDPDPDAEE